MSLVDDMRDSKITVSDIFNQQYQQDRNQQLGAAVIIGRNRDYNREPDYWIYVFSIVPREFIRRRPPDFPMIRLSGCPKGEPWALVAKVPDTVRYKWISAETGSPVFDSIPGERFATDLINPANLGNQMWVDVSTPDMDQMHGGGDDLSRRGVFWSRNEKPTAEELNRSKVRLEKHYRECVAKANVLAASPKTIDEIGEEHHLAADYLHVNASWHQRSSVQEACPNCGEPINPGVAYHASSLGGRCILDWPRAVASGVVKRDEVPEDLRWWPAEPQAAVSASGFTPKQ